MSNRKIALAFVLATGAVSLGLADLAHAADALEEVTVTATRRVENVQDVPIPITALSADALVQGGVTSTEDIAQLTPGLNLTQQAGALISYIRGVGSPDGSAGQEASVTMYLDGVLIPAPYASIFDLANVEHVEVDKGPQGTLFGRNSNGGAIQVFTRTPSSKPALDVSAGYGNYNTGEFKVYGTTGISPNLAADLSVYYRSQGNPIGYNITTGSGWGNGDELNLRSKWLWTPTESTSVTLAGGYTRQNTGGWGNTKQIFPGTTAADHVTTYTGNYYNYTGDVNATGFNQGETASLTIDTNQPWFEFKSITAYQNFDANQNFDNDESPIVNTDVYINGQRYHTVTEELQFLSPKDSPVKWIGGAFFMNNASGFSGPLGLGLGLAATPIGPGGINIKDIIKTKTYAVFGETTIPASVVGLGVLGDTNLVAGIRYNTDQRDATGYVEQGIVNNVATLSTLLTTPSGSKKYNKATYRAILNHKFDEHTMVYASYSLGFKAGNFNTVTFPAVTSYDPETLNAYELGTKTEWLQGRLRLNVDGFYYQYKNMQLPIYIGPSLTTVNAASATLKGIEIEGEALPVDALDIRYGVTIEQGSFDSFPNGPVTLPLTDPRCAVAALNPAANNYTAGPIDCLYSGNQSGNTTPHTPKVSLNLSPTYTLQTAQGKFDATVSYSYTGAYYWDSTNNRQQNAYSLVNANVGWLDPSGRYGINIWGKNLGSTQYMIYAVAQGTGDSFAAAAPRTFGVTFNLHLK